MPLRRLSLAVSPLLSAVEWAFCADVPCVDVLLGGVATWWFGMQMLRPDVFDRYNFVGMQWAPDAAWIAFVAVLVLLHAAGLFDRRLYKVRAAGCLLSAWYWICVSISLTRLGLSPGTGTYAILGLGSLAAAVYLTGRESRVG